MELDKEQIELLENALNVASDKFTYAEFSQDEMKLVFDAQHLVKTLTIPVVRERTLGINSCAALIKSMPTDQAIQIIKADITSQPQSTIIGGSLVVAYVP